RRPGRRRSTERKKGCGNAGSVESVEKQKQLSHAFHRPLEISPTTRDFHIPTARASRPWESGKPKPGFPLSHRRSRRRPLFSLSNRKTKKGSRPPSGRLILTFQDHAVLETGFGFRIILGLENAPGGAKITGYMTLGGRLATSFCLFSGVLCAQGTGTI